MMLWSQKKNPFDNLNDVEIVFTKRGETKEIPCINKISHENLGNTIGDKIIKYTLST